MNYRMITHTLGWVLIFEALAMSLAAVCGLIYHEREVIDFLICIAICLAVGLLLTVTSPKNKAMYSKEGYLIVALSWIFISVFGALPFVISHSIPRFVDALFETASGFSTTGASILFDLDAMPRCMLFWRSFTHWIGGMGVLVFLMAVLPLSGVNNLYMMKAESPGPSVGKLVPKVRSTAKILYTIYFAFTVLEFVFLMFGGIGVFDSITLSFGTAGTGGFAVRTSGFADYSPYVQNVITVFMYLFGVNFSLYYLLLIRKFKSVFKSEELWTYLGIIFAAITAITINCRHLFVSLGETIHHAAFQVAALITTSGFSTVDFDIWPTFSKTIVVGLMFIGAMAGSTGGGIKISRIIILIKSIFKEIKTTAHPKSTSKITMDGHLVEHETVRGVNVYMAAYIFVFAASILIVSLDNFDYTTNFTAVLSAINNIGPGLNAVGPTKNFAAFSDLSKITLTLDMIIGRLEIFPMLMLFSPYSWKK